MLPSQSLYVKLVKFVIQPYYLTSFDDPYPVSYTYIDCPHTPSATSRGWRDRSHQNAALPFGLYAADAECLDGIHARQGGLWRYYRTLDPYRSAIVIVIATAKYYCPSDD